jgi:hypothetical protein
VRNKSQSASNKTTTEVNYTSAAARIKAALIPMKRDQRLPSLLLNDQKILDRNIRRNLSKSKNDLL